MLRTWWGVFLLPALMLTVGAAARFLPIKRLYPRSLPPRQQRVADELLAGMMRRFSPAMAALGFMLMQTLRLLPRMTQQIAAYIFILLEVLALTAMTLPIEQTLRERFGDVPADRTVSETARAKVNLLLAVGNLREDGFHDLVSVMQTIDLCDDLVLRATEGGIELTCDRNDLLADDSNLCHKAAVKFFTHTRLDHAGVSIELKKRIPMQAGLGGGSADAAAVLRGLRRLFAPEMTDGELELIAADLGSDIPFCVRGGTVLAQGRGEVLKDLPDLPECWFVVSKPGFACSTAEMYGLIDRLRCYDSGREETAAMTEALERGDLSGVCGSVLNTFERVLPASSAVSVIRSRLQEMGALCAMLCGSGSAVFGIFREEEKARMAAAALRGTYPETFCCTGK